MENIYEKERLVLPGQTCDAKLHRIKEYNWIIQKWFPATISTTFWGSGRVTLKFDNCNNQGEVSVLVDGTEIANSKPNGEEPKATFNVEEGTVLEIKADNQAIIRINDLKIECGKDLFFYRFTTFGSYKNKIVLVFLKLKIYLILQRCVCYHSRNSSCL